MENQSINQASGPEAVDAQPEMQSEGAAYETGAVPDWCNLGVTLRVIVGVNVLFGALALASSTGLRGWFDAFLSAAVTVEPVLIASLFVACLLRRLTWRWPEMAQIALAVMLPAVLTFAYQSALAPVLDFANGRIWRNAACAALIAATVVYWGWLRYRAFAPALTEARLQALQARIRPHFLFNSLNAVLGLIRSDPRRAETILEDLADLFRALLRDRRERVTLAEEIDLCKRYLSIEALRLGERLQVVWHVDARALAARVPGLLLQPLIENAVHHGIEPDPAGGRIDIDVAWSDGVIDIRIANPWQERFTPDGQRPGNHIALDNIRQRLTLAFDLEASLDTTLHDGRFVVRLRLPMKTGA